MLLAKCAVQLEVTLPYLCDIEWKLGGLGLCGKVLVTGRGSGVASGRRFQKLLLCQTELVPAGSKTDLPLAKTEPMSNIASASM